MTGPISGTYKGPNSNYTCCRNCDVPISPDYSPYCSKCAGDLTGMSEERRVLYWAFERLGADCNNERTNKATAEEIGKFLLGRPTNITKFVPDEYQQLDPTR